MVEDEKRKRAPAMSQEERRAAIVRTTLPLLIEHGGTVSTSQIAAAAGIAEGTVFRAFKDKQDLLIECMRAGLDSDAEIARIEAIDSSLPLRQRLIEGVEAIGGYLERVWTVGQALQTAGIGREEMHQHVHDKPGQQDAGPPAQIIRISQTFGRLFDQSAHELRVSSDRAVRMLLGLIFSNRMQGPGIEAAMDDPAEIVDLFLHGVIRTEEGNQP